MSGAERRGDGRAGAMAARQVEPGPAVNALAEAVTLAGAEGRAVAWYGEATAGVGRAPRGDAVALTPPATLGGWLDRNAAETDDADDPRQGGPAIELWRPDFTVRAAAGVTWGVLRSRLAAAGQAVALDAPDRATVAEVIDANLFGPWRVSAGTVRDLLLGLAMVDGEGRWLRVGGRTVKNVAGLDVTRLLCGGLGEFGLVTEATLRTVAVPRSASRATVRVARPEAWAALGTPLLRDAAAPAWMVARLETSRSGADRADRALRVTLGWHGSERAVAAGREALGRYVDGAVGLELLEAGDPDAPGDAFDRDVAARGEARVAVDAAPASLQLVTPPSLAATTVALADRLAPAGSRVTGLPSEGVWWIGGDWDRDAAAALGRGIVEALRAERRPHQLTWLRRPAGAGGRGEVGTAAPGLEPFQPGPEPLDLLRRVKRAMDPQGVLNPGRLLPSTPEPAAMTTAAPGGAI